MFPLPPRVLNPRRPTSPGGNLPCQRAAIQGASAAEQASHANGSDRARRPPASLLRHPTVMGILLEALFHPAHRSSVEDLRAG